MLIYKRLTIKHLLKISIIILSLTLLTFHLILNYIQIISASLTICQNHTILASNKQLKNDANLIEFNYHNYASMVQLLRRLATKFSHLIQINSIGTTVKRRQILVALITSNVTSKQYQLLKPNFRYTANMHGNEVLGREMMLHLIVYLLKNYNTDYNINKLLKTTRLHIMPSMNPDGAESSIEGLCSSSSSRFNALGFDLNRNFPNYVGKSNSREQIETKAVRDWLSKVNFPLAAGLHGGALVACYPFDSLVRVGKLNASFKTPDDDTFKYLASTYARTHPYMHLGKSCGRNEPKFFGGIGNGAAWYEFQGGLPDYAYTNLGTLELTIELACCKHPKKKELINEWRMHKKSLIELIWQIHKGIRGLIRNKKNQPISGAVLAIENRAFGFRSTSYGEFWRILLPGKYSLNVQARGYKSKRIPFIVHQNNATFLSIVMDPLK